MIESQRFSLDCDVKHNFLLLFKIWRVFLRSLVETTKWIFAKRSRDFVSSGFFELVLSRAGNKDFSARNRIVKERPQNEIKEESCTPVSSAIRPTFVERRAPTSPSSVYSLFNLSCDRSFTTWKFVRRKRGREEPPRARAERARFFIFSSRSFARIRKFIVARLSFFFSRAKRKLCEKTRFCLLRKI